MGTVLEEADVVASVRAFTDAYNDNVNAARIQAGSYNLKKQMAARDAVAALLDPANKAEITVTVPEGFHAKQVYERIASVSGLPDGGGRGRREGPGRHRAARRGRRQPRGLARRRDVHLRARRRRRQHAAAAWSR